MRWVSFILFAALVLTLQSTIAVRFTLWGTRPDWLLAVVVFLGFRARRFDAVVGAWVLGALADLMTVERFGLLALSYAAAAMLIVSVRDLLFRDHGLTQFVVALIVSLMLQTVWLLYRRVLYDPAMPLFQDIALAVLLGSVYTALWAPLFHAILLPLSGVLGIPRPRYSHAGLRRLRGDHV